MQDKAHAQAHVKHTKADAGHARRNSPRKQVQGTRASRLCVDGFVLQDKQHGKARETRDTGTCSLRACSERTQRKVPGVSLPLSLVCFNRAGHQGNATLENGQKRP